MTRLVLVTGVAGGIGRATVAAFREAGWAVAGLDIVATPPRELELDAFTRLDLGAGEALDQLSTFVDELPRLDALVNNAAVQFTRPITETGVEDWDRTLSINLRAAYLTVRAGQAALGRNGGAVVNVSSIHAMATSVGLAAYAASKGGLLAFTRSIALELAPQRIRANAVLPGAVDTAMLRDGVSRWAGSVEMDAALHALGERTPLGRIGRPSEVAQAILFLSDTERSSYITGQALIVDGGVTAALSSEVQL